MSGTLEGKVIIVTGAATGIGRAAATLFAENGAKLLLADTNERDGLSIAADISATGAAVEFLKTDVSDADQAAAMVELAVTSFGRLDGAFNNAGIGYPHARLHELDLSDWEKALRINLTGVFLCMKYEIAAMLKSGGGSIVNTGSIASVVALPLAPGYNASKHGVLGLTRNAALDYGLDGIRVNAILPGGTKTPMVDRQRAARREGQPGGEDKSFLKRMAEPIEIAEGAAWLLSNHSGFVTGHALNLDGGFVVA